jgi:hypothetical protein
VSKMNVHWEVLSVHMFQARNYPAGCDWIWYYEHGKMGNPYTILVGNPEGKHRRKWKDSIRTYLKETGCGGVVWIYLAQDRHQRLSLVNTVMYLRFHNRWAVFRLAGRLLSWTLLHGIGCCSWVFTNIFVRKFNFGPTGPRSSNLSFIYLLINLRVQQYTDCRSNEGLRYLFETFFSVSCIFNEI